MPSYDELAQDNQELRAKLAEAEETLHAIHNGEVDALIISTPQANQVFALQSADHAYRMLIEKMNQGAVTILVDGVMLYSNQCFAEIIASPLDTLVAKSIYHYVASEDHQRFADLIQTAQSRKNLHGEFLLQNDAGETIPVDIAVNVLPFSQLLILGLVITDLREQKQREEEKHLLKTLQLQIAQAENFEAALLFLLKHICQKTEWEIGEVWMSVADTLQRVASWHSDVPAAADFDQQSRNLQIPPGNGLAGQVWSKKEPIWFPVVIEEPIFEREQLVRQVGIQSGMGIPVWADQAIVAVIIFFTLQSRLKDEQFIDLISSVAAYLGTYMVRKQADERIHYQVKLLETVHDPIISTDLNDTIVSWNKAAEDLYGWKMQEVIGRPLREVLTPQYPFDVAENIITQFQEQEIWCGDVIHSTRNAEVIDTIASVTMVRDENGKPIGTVGTYRDIRERIQSEKELRNYSAVI